MSDRLMVPLGAAVVGGLLMYRVWQGGSMSTPPTGQPGRYFTWSELTRSGTAVDLGLDNTPPAAAQAELRALVARVLDPLRASLGRPVSVTSGYRSVALNQAIGGAQESQHMVGQAADLKVTGVAAVDLARRVRELRLPIDQAIWYDLARGGQLHLSHRSDGRNRGEYLHAPASGGFVLWEG
jgi:hypothetical protein